MTSLNRYWLAATVLFAAPAWAHVTLETRQAAPGSHYKAAFSVSHGCKGSATRSVSIRIPAGVIAIKPQPKPGWEIALAEGAYAKPYQFHGRSVSEGVQEVTWSGNLPDAYFDEFVFKAYLTADLPPGQLAFEVVQKCESGEQRWIGAADSDMPAPRLLLKARETNQ